MKKYELHFYMQYSYGFCQFGGLYMNSGGYFFFQALNEF